MANNFHANRLSNQFYPSSLLSQECSYRNSCTSFDSLHISQKIKMQALYKMFRNSQPKNQESGSRRSQWHRQSNNEFKITNGENRKTHLVKMIQILQHQKQNLLSRQKYLAKQEHRIDRLNLEIQQKLGLFQQQAVQNRQNRQPQSQKNEPKRPSIKNAAFRQLQTINKTQIK